VRVIDQQKCVGCQTCLRLCPHPAHRTVWNAETKKATKCDLCSDAPYLGQEGGPGGKQACVMACPMGALAVVTQVPNQTDDTGYRVNLRKA
jgi:protein NrfC